MILPLSTAESRIPPDLASEEWWFEFESYILPAVLSASKKLMTAIFAQLLSASALCGKSCKMILNI